MQTFILVLALMLLSLGGLAIGLFFGRGPIKGSCGGLACSSGSPCACGRHAGKEGRQ